MMPTREEIRQIMDDPDMSDDQIDDLQEKIDNLLKTTITIFAEKVQVQK